jgi:hypothetical protein
VQSAGCGHAKPRKGVMRKGSVHSGSSVGDRGPRMNIWLPQKSAPPLSFKIKVEVS